MKPKDSGSIYGGSIGVCLTSEKSFGVQPHANWSFLPKRGKYIETDQLARKNDWRQEWHLSDVLRA